MVVWVFVHSEYEAGKLHMSGTGNGCGYTFSETQKVGVSLGERDDGGSVLDLRCVPGKTSFGERSSRLDIEI